MKILVMVMTCAACLLGGCRVSDVRPLTVHVPGLATQADVDKIRKVLAPLNGIQRDKLVFDVQAHEVRLSFDSMVIAHKNIEVAIAEAGYDANEITAASAVSQK